jgi:plasmid stability protein
VAQILIRQLEDDVRERLRRRARRHGRSTEEEVREILRNAVRDELGDEPQSLGSRIAARFNVVGLDQDLPELRGQEPEPAEFDE